MKNQTIVTMCRALDDYLDMDGGRCAVDKEHRDAMKLYLESWARPIVKAIEDIATGKKNARRAYYDAGSPRPRLNRQHVTDRIDSTPNKP